MEAVAAREVARSHRLKAKDERLGNRRVTDGSYCGPLGARGSRSQIFFEESYGLATMVLGSLLPLPLRRLLVRNQTASREIEETVHKSSMPESHWNNDLQERILVVGEGKDPSDLARKMLEEKLVDATVDAFH